MQHIAGISGARNVVAINRDGDANIFKYARYGIVGDWKQVLPGLYPALEGAARLTLRFLGALLAVAVLGGLRRAAAARQRRRHGVLLEVESPSIQRVERFTLRTDDGQELKFSAAPDFNRGPATR